jgi:hypothetical protein
MVCKPWYGERVTACHDWYGVRKAIVCVFCGCQLVIRGGGLSTLTVKGGSTYHSGAFPSLWVRQLRARACVLCAGYQGGLCCSVAFHSPTGCETTELSGDFLVNGWHKCICKSDCYRCNIDCLTDCACQSARLYAVQGRLCNETRYPVGISRNFGNGTRRLRNSPAHFLVQKHISYRFTQIKALHQKALHHRCDCRQQRQRSLLTSTAHC